MVNEEEEEEGDGPRRNRTRMRRMKRRILTDEKEENGYRRTISESQVIKLK